MTFSLRPGGHVGDDSVCEKSKLDMSYHIIWRRLIIVVAVLGQKFDDKSKFVSFTHDG